MTSIATAYEVTFHPADSNVCPADCMDTYCHDTLAAAQTAIAEDAKDTAGSILHHDYPAWKAYAIASAIAAVDALEGADTYAYPITVTSGDNPRPIGTYRIRIIHEGDLMECTACGSGDGSVTAIHGGGNVHATCPDCDGGGIIDTRPHYSPGFAQWLAQAVNDDDPANGGHGILTIDDADADAQRLDEIDTYLRSPAARWAPCGTLDALDDERAELQRRIEDRRIASTRNAQH